MHGKTIEKPDISEHGAPKDGQPQTMDRRLFVQLLAFGNCKDNKPLIAALEQEGVDGALYEDINDPQGIALLTFSEDPNLFVDKIRTFLNAEPFVSLTPKPEYTMLGRTYALGYEPDLQETLFDRPRNTALNPQWPWAVWYPIRRSGSFNNLPADEQRSILREHGVIGMAFGRNDLAHDIRLVCHGLDKNDSDFVVGLLGKDLFPLSALIQAMRKTTQTSLYLERLGPFFVGKVAWQSKSNSD